MNRSWMTFKWRLLESVLGDGAPGGDGLASTAPASAPESGEGDSSLFSELAEHDENVEPVEAPSAPVVPAAPVPPAAASPPVVVPPAAAPGLPSQVPPGGPPATPAAVPPGTPAAAGTQPPAASTEQPPGTPAVIDFEKHRAEFLPKLAEQLYKLDDADVEALRTDPGKIMPILAARVHYEVQHAVFAGVMNSLPQMIQMLTERNKEFESNETSFYTQFPTLKEKPEYTAVVAQSIQAIRNANPQISREDLMKRAGIMASITLGLQMPGTVQQPPPGAPPPPAPASNFAGQRPTGVGSVAHVIPPAAPGSPEEDVLGSLIDAHLDGSI